MPSMLSVARGCTSARVMFMPSASVQYSVIYRSATSGTVMPSSLAFLMSLSSISVKFCTKVTS